MKWFGALLIAASLVTLGCSQDPAKSVKIISRPNQPASAITIAFPSLQAEWESGEEDRPPRLRPPTPSRCLPKPRRRSGDQRKSLPLCLRPSQMG